MADIFISYAHEDRERAKALAQALAEQGWSVWWDRHIPGGQRFHEVIERELAAARCVIALWSTAALDSPWVREEAQDGLDRQILVPAKIETVRLPIGFRTVQTADLSNWKGNPAHPGFVQLIEDTTTVLGECPKQQALEPEVKPEKPVEPLESKRVPLPDDRPAPTGMRTQKPSLKAAWERFRAHVRLPDGQTLLSKKAIIIGGVSVVLLASLSLLIPPKLGEEIERGTIPVPGVTHTPGQNSARDATAQLAPTSSRKDDVPDWVPVYPFADQENVFLRRGAGSISFETENGAQHVSEAYAAKLKAAGWKVRTSWSGGGLYSTAGTSPEQQRSVAVAAHSAEGNTHVAVSFLDSSVVQSEESFSPNSVPSWIPVYPGKVDDLRYKGNSGGFSITTTDSAQQVSVLYEAVLGASGYEVVAGWSGAGHYNVQGTAKSQGRSIAASTNTDNNVTKVLVLFEQQKKQEVP
jgi:hypothetical protein